MGNVPNYIGDDFIVNKANLPARDEADKELSAKLEVRPSLSPEIERHMDIGEAVAQAIIILDKGDIKKFSYLTAKEEAAFALWYSIAQSYNLQMVMDYINNSLRMRVSIDGRGRNDIVKIASSQITTQSPETSFVGRFRRMIGL